MMELSLSVGNRDITPIRDVFSPTNSENSNNAVLSSYMKFRALLSQKSSHKPQMLQTQTVNLSSSRSPQRQNAIIDEIVLQPLRSYRDHTGGGMMINALETNNLQPKVFNTPGFKKYYDQILEQPKIVFKKEKKSRYQTYDIRAPSTVSKGNNTVQSRES